MILIEWALIERNNYCEGVIKSAVVKFLWEYLIYSNFLNIYLNIPKKTK